MIYYVKSDELKKENSGNYDGLLETFDSENKARISKKTGRAKLQSLIAHALTLYALEQCGIKNLQAHRNSHGMPYFTQGNNKNICSNKYLSCTHTDYIIAVALHDEPVGIDIESVRNFNPKIAKRIFTDEECAIILKSDDQNLAFTQAWTRYEAFGKMLGIGLAKSQNYMQACTPFTAQIGEYVMSVVSEKPLSKKDIHEVLLINLI